MNRACSRSRLRNPLPFTPLNLFSIGEQGAWYDPSDMTTLFQDDAGATPVTAADQPVGRMLDKSGRGNNATQATAASRPVLRNTGDLWWLEFDGIDDFLVTGAVNFSATDKLTLFVGLEKLTDTVVGSVICLGSNVVLNSFELATPNTIGTSDAQFRMSGTGSATRRTLSAPINTPLVLTGIGNLAGSTVADEANLRVNGVVSATAAQGTTSTGNLGNAALFIGRRAGTSLPANINLYSLIVRGASSDTPTLVATEKYAGGKTGVILP